jgi:hypothetical protein
LENAVGEKSTIAGLISKAAKKLRADFEHIRETVSHSGEKGSETEDKVREFLNGHLPKRFHATKGFVIDADNQHRLHEITSETVAGDRYAALPSLDRVLRRPTLAALPIPARSKDKRASRLAD